MLTAPLSGYVFKVGDRHVASVVRGGERRVHGWVGRTKHSEKLKWKCARPFSPRAVHRIAKTGEDFEKLSWSARCETGFPRFCPKS